MQISNLPPLPTRGHKPSHTEHSVSRDFAKKATDSGIMRKLRFLFNATTDSLKTFMIPAAVSLSIFAFGLYNIVSTPVMMLKGLRLTVIQFYDDVVNSPKDRLTKCQDQAEKARAEENEKNIILNEAVKKLKKAKANGANTQQLEELEEEVRNRREEAYYAQKIADEYQHKADEKYNTLSKDMQDFAHTSKFSIIFKATFNGIKTFGTKSVLGPLRSLSKGLGGIAFSPVVLGFSPILGIKQLYDNVVKASEAELNRYQEAAEKSRKNIERMRPLTYALGENLDQKMKKLEEAKKQGKNTTQLETEVNNAHKMTYEQEQKMHKEQIELRHIESEIKRLKKLI
ncbi:MAG: hypothetical protein OXD32_07885 [Endozoicomonadaceae bacterium]|nr:hypothetical protein [Endozoicomonadaceae bacterium]MCY4329255.1 hypothetical protein [Endozoicomonadaceae bacterium]